MHVKTVIHIHSRIMLHQPYGGVGWTSEDIAIQAKEILELKKITSKLLSQFTGQPLDKILEDSERNFYMYPESALAYGLVDHIAKPPQHSTAAGVVFLPH